MHRLSKAKQGDKMKRILTMLGTMVMSLIFITGCSAANSTSDTTSLNGDSNGKVNKEAEFVLEYPQDMQELGFTEPMVLEEVPERIISLSASPVLALYEMEANLVGVTSSAVVAWPEDLLASTESVTFSAMSDGEWDFELILALEPDLVFLAHAAADTAGEALESLGINVYYVYAGHTVSYESIKMQTEVIVEAFSVDEESEAKGEAIMQRFADLEEQLVAAKEAFAGNKVLVLQSGSATAHYAQTNAGTLGSMLEQLGFENVYENESTSMALLDYEQALSYEPDYIVCVGSTSAEAQENLMQTAFENNPEYWNSMTAVQNGNVVCLGAEYISSSGINIINNISGLMGIMSEATGIRVK